MHKKKKEDYRLANYTKNSRKFDNQIVSKLDSLQVEFELLFDNFNISYEKAGNSFFIYCNKMNNKSSTFNSFHLQASRASGKSSSLYSILQASFSTIRNPIITIKKYNNRLIIQSTYLDLIQIDKDIMMKFGIDLEDFKLKVKKQKLFLEQNSLVDILREILINYHQFSNQL